MDMPLPRLPGIDPVKRFTLGPDPALPAPAPRPAVEHAMILSAEAEILPGFADEAARLEAFKKVASEGKTVAATAAELGLDLRTVHVWAKRGNWLKLAREAADSAAEEAAIAARNARSKNTLAALEKGVSTAKKIMDAVDDQLDTELSPQQLKFAAEAAKAASGVLTEAFALGSPELQDGSVSAGKAPLVVVVQGGGVPEVKVAEKTTNPGLTIDAETV